MSTIVKVLKDAKKILASNYHEGHNALGPHETFICFAIDPLLRLPIRNKITKERVKEIINHRLDGNDTVVHWLVKNGYYADLDSLSVEERYDQIQAYRHRWLDSLIEEFS